MARWEREEAEFYHRETGAGMAKNDDREVPKQIKALRRLGVELKASIDNLWTSNGQLEETVEKLDEATMAHIGALNKRISEMAITIGHAKMELDETERRKILELAEDVRVLRDDHMAFQNRQVGFNEATIERMDAFDRFREIMEQGVNDLGKKAEWIQEAGAEGQAGIENRLDALEGYPRRVVESEDVIQQFGAPWAGEDEPPHDFSYPVGVGKHPEMERITGMAAVRKEQYGKGLMAGKALIEDRVIKVLVEMGWNSKSPAMETVLAAIRGE